MRYDDQVYTFLALVLTNTMITIDRKAPTIKPTNGKHIAQFARNHDMRLTYIVYRAYCIEYNHVNAFEYFTR